MLHIPPETFEQKSPYTTATAEALILGHGAMVRRIAWHVHSRLSASVGLEDLIQIGLIALIEAARSYEDRGHAFSTYASMRVRGAMVDQLRREALVGRSAMHARRTISQTRAKLEQSLMRAPDSSEMAEAMGVSLPAYLDLELRSQPVEQASIDEHYSDHDAWFADTVESAEQRIERQQMRALLAQHVGDLPEREAMVLQLFFVEELNLHEIGAVLGIGAPRVCQIKKAALAKLRIALSDYR
ncbi:MAG: sigma-70 family RNA polymerase sigma factor [Sphingorhabdus sp.]